MSENSADDFFNQGLRHQKSGDLQRASACYSQVLELQPDHYLALNNAALIAWDMGHSNMALKILHAAKKLAPHDQDILKNLASIQLKLEDPESAEENLRTALRYAGNDHDLRLTLADVLYERGKIDEARSLLEKSLDRQNPQLQIVFRLGVICMRQGEADQATGFFTKALTIEPQNIAVMNQLADHYLLNRRLEEARDLLDKILQLSAGNTRALSQLAVLLNLAGDRESLLELYAADTLLRETFVTVPGDYSTLHQFNAALIACTEQFAEMWTDSEHRATFNGLQSRSISALPTPVMAHMNELINSATAAMRERCKKLPQFQFSRAIPDRYKVESWIVRLNDGGFQKPHVHPVGWLSGCYYLQVPGEVRQGDSKSGWLEFGRTEEVYGVSSPVVFHHVQPEPGKLVTFPSYYWHCTVPFTSTEERICIAFDIRPS